MPLPVVTSDTLSTGTASTKALTSGKGTSISPTATEDFTSLEAPQSESLGSTMPSSTPSSTLATTTRTSELLTATASDGIPTYDWGPAITASSLPLAATSAANADSPQPVGGMSNGARNTLIATTTIGGTFILAFLIYALWQRRKGATYGEIIRFRAHSSSIMLSPGPRSDFTALPIYRESRYSVRVSKRGSMLSFSKLMNKRAPSPSSESFSKGPWLRNQWKMANPPTPTRTGHPLSQVMTARVPPSPPLKAPEMARMSMSDSSERIRINRTVSEGDLSKPWPTISTEEVAPSPEPHRTKAPPPPSEPKTPVQDDSRWSWTNSQAPATPRMRTRSPTRRASKSSTGSLSKFRRMHSWVRYQSDHTSGKISEEAPKAATKPKLPPLKNKASKPILAPAPSRPTRRLSKKAGPPQASTSRPSTGVASQKKDMDSRPTTSG